MRLIISIVALVVAFGFALWQNHALLDILNRPLTNATAQVDRDAKGPQGAEARFDAAQREALSANAAALGRLSRSDAARLGDADRRALAAASAADAAALRAAPREPPGKQPVTLGLDRAVHADAHGGRLLRGAVRAADHPLPGLRVPAAGLEPARPPERAAAAGDGPGAVRHGRRVRLRARAAGRRRVPPGLQPGAVRRARAGAAVLRLHDHDDGGDGAAVPDPGRRARAHAAGASSPRPSCARTAATRSS